LQTNDLVPDRLPPARNVGSTDRFLGTTTAKPTDMNDRISINEVWLGVLRFLLTTLAFNRGEESHVNRCH